MPIQPHRRAGRETHPGVSPVKAAARRTTRSGPRGSTAPSRQYLRERRLVHRKPASRAAQRRTRAGPSPVPRPVCELRVLEALLPHPAGLLSVDAVERAPAVGELISLREVVDTTGVLRQALKPTELRLRSPPCPSVADGPFVRTGPDPTRTPVPARCRRRRGSGPTPPNTNGHPPRGLLGGAVAGLCPLGWVLWRGHVPRREEGDTGPELQRTG